MAKSNDDKIGTEGTFDCDYNSLRHALRELTHFIAESIDCKIGTEGTLTVIIIPCGMFYQNWFTQWQRVAMTKLVLREL